MIFVSDKKKGSYGNKTDYLEISDSALYHDIRRRHASAVHTQGRRTHGGMAMTKADSCKRSKYLPTLIKKTCNMNMARKIISEALKETALLIRFSRCFIRITGRRKEYTWKMQE